MLKTKSTFYLKFLICRGFLHGKNRYFLGAPRPSRCRQQENSEQKKVLLLALDFKDFSGSGQLKPSHHGALIAQGPTSEHGKLQLSGMVTPKPITTSIRTSSLYRVRDVRDVVHRRDLFKVADLV